MSHLLESQMTKIKSSERFEYSIHNGYGRMTVEETTKCTDKPHVVSIHSWWVPLNHLDNIFAIRLLLQLFGINVFPVKGFCRLFEFFCLLLSIFSSIVQISFAIYLFLASNQPISATLWTFQAIYAGFIRYILWTRAKKIYTLIIIMVNILQCEMTKFRKWSVWCFFIALVFVLSDYIRLVTWFEGSFNQELVDLYNSSARVKYIPWMPMEAFAYLDFWTYAYSTIGALIVSKSFYLFCFHLTCECYRLLGPFARENIRDFRNLKNITRQYHKIHNLKEELNECLNGLPFLWYSHIFFETTSQIATRTKHFELTWQVVIYHWGSYLNLLIITVYITYQVDVYTLKEIGVVRKIIQKLSESQPSNINLSKNYLISKQILIMEMDRSPTITPTAWDSFEINRNLIMSFFGAVAPFSVMCLEFQQILKDDPPPECTCHCPAVVNPI